MKARLGSNAEETLDLAFCGLAMDSVRAPRDSSDSLFFGEDVDAVVNRAAGSPATFGPAVLSSCPRGVVSDMRSRYLPVISLPPAT